MKGGGGEGIKSFFYYLMHASYLSKSATYTHSAP